MTFEQKKAYFAVRRTVILDALASLPYTKSGWRSSEILKMARVIGKGRGLTLKLNENSVSHDLKVLRHDDCATLSGRSRAARWHVAPRLRDKRSED